MVEVKTVSLHDVPGGASIEFIRAQKYMGEYAYSPFVIIHYSLNGKEQEYGLRLDLDKGIFLDHFENSDQEEVLTQATPKIIDLLDPLLDELINLS